MSYQHDEQAVEEAAQFALPGDKVDEVSAWLSTAQSDLGAEGVLGHRIHYDPQKWEGLLPALLLGRDSISRGEAFAMAAVGDLGNVFTASYIWGVGRVGYGPRRLRDIIDSTGGQLDETLRRAADAAAQDVIRGYAMLYGGDDRKHRASPNDPRWARIHRFGPAFFTKFLYFTTPGALILDNVLARKVRRLSGMPYLVRPRGQSYEWSPYRYAVYLHWMRQSAATLSSTPEELELALFTMPG